MDLRAPVSSSNRLMKTMGSALLFSEPRKGQQQVVCEPLFLINHRIDGRINYVAYFGSRTPGMPIIDLIFIVGFF